MATNTSYINSISRDYVITSNPGFNMYGFFNYTNRTTHNINSTTYIPSNFNVYTATARQWAYCFCNRKDLTSIPDYDMSNAKNFYNTFGSCSNLTTTPSIPTGVTDMTRTFYGCSNLTQPPVIPSTVTQMYYAFYGCSKLQNPPNIPTSVTNMLSTFYSCTNIRGDMYIFSNNITCAATCFKSKSRSYRLNIHCYSGTSTYSTFNSYLKGTSNSQLNIRLQTM